MTHSFLAAAGTVPQQANMSVPTGVGISATVLAAVILGGLAWYNMKHKGMKKGHLALGVALGIAIGGGLVGQLVHQGFDTTGSTAASIVTNIGGNGAQAGTGQNTAGN